MRRRGKVDANHAAIVAHLKALGCSVQSLASVGGGVPDLLVGRRGVNVLIELKDGSKSPSERRLTPDQVEWHRRWAGQVAVAETAQEAEEIMNVAEKWARVA